MSGLARPSLQQLQMTERVGANHSVRLLIRGELDLAVAEEFEDRVIELSRRFARVELDLSELGFIDACGLRAVVSSMKASSRSRGRVVLDTNVSAPVLRLIDVVGGTAWLWSGDQRTQDRVRTIWLRAVA